jgi:hypothetical protein
MQQPPARRKDTALPSLTPVDTMGVIGEQADRFCCVESLCQTGNVKAWEKRGACVRGMESVSNSAAQSPWAIDPDGHGERFQAET